MLKRLNVFMRLLNNEEGVTAIEYGLIAAAIIIAIYLLVNAAGTSTSSTFSAINSAI